MVCFERPARFNNISALRSLGNLSAFMASNDGEAFERGGYAAENMVSFVSPKAVGLVYVSDTSRLLPVSKKLAETYVLNGDEPAALCRQNADAAREYGRDDLYKTWILLSKVMEMNLTPGHKIEEIFTPPWAIHPFGRPLVDSLFEYYIKMKDVQMLAMMACMLSKQYLPDELEAEIRASRHGGLAEANSQVVRPQRYSNSDGLQVSPEFPEFLKVAKWQSDKLSASADENWSPPTFIEQKTKDPYSEERTKHALNSRLLGIDYDQYDKYRMTYAAILYRWNLTAQRTEVLKFVENGEEPPGGIYISLECSECKRSQRQPFCPGCKKIIVKCSVCRIGVRGLLSFCLVCGHGGHMFHMMRWFNKEDWCATGCGCYCLRIGKFGTGE